MMKSRLIRFALAIAMVGGLTWLETFPAVADQASTTGQAYEKEAQRRPPSPPVPPPIPVRATVSVGRHPLGVATHPTFSQAVVANNEARNVSILSILNPSVLATIDVGRGPTGVAINALANYAVVTLRAEHAAVVVSLDNFNPASDRVVSKFRVGRGPQGVGVDPGLNLAVVANQESNTVSIVDLTDPRAPRVTELGVGKKPMGVAVNPMTHTAAVTNRRDGTVTLLSLAPPGIIGVIPLPGSRPHRNSESERGDDRDRDRRPRPIGVAFDFGATVNRVVVADPGTHSVDILTLGLCPSATCNTLSQIQSLPVGRKPMAVAANPGNDFALVTSDKNEVFGVTLTAPALAGLATVGKHPRGVAIDPGICRAPVTNFGDNSVSILDVPCRAILQIFSLSPPSVQAGSGAFTLTISGIGFGNDATVNFGASTGLHPTSVTATTITIVLAAPSIVGQVLVSVSSNGRTSNTLSLDVTATPPPVLSSVSPATALATGDDLPLTLVGTRFAAGAAVTFAGVTISATVVSATTITATVPGFPLTLGGGTFDIQVVNLPPGGSSNTLAYVLTNPQPVISTLLPNNATQGSSEISMLINGFGLAAQFVVQPSGGSLVALTSVTFSGPGLPQPVALAAVPSAVSPTHQLVVTIPATLLQAAGAFTVTVENPPFGSGLVASQPFTVLPNIVPPGVSVRTLEIPEGHPDQVVVFRQGARVLGAMTLPDTGFVRLLNLTDPANPALEPGGAIPVTGPGFQVFGGIDVHLGTQTLVTTLPNANQVTVIRLSASGPPTISTVPVGTFPFAVAVDPVNDRAIVANVGDVFAGGTTSPSLSIVDLNPLNLSEIARFPLTGLTNPAAVAVNPQTGIAAVVEQIPAGPPAFAPQPGFLYLVNLLNGRIAPAIPVGLTPVSVAINANPATSGVPGGIALVTNEDDQVPGSLDGTMSIINLSTRGVVATVPVGQSPTGVAVDPATNKALVANFLNNQVITVNVTQASITPTPSGATGLIQLGLAPAITPLSIGWQPDPTLGVALLSTLTRPSNKDFAIVIGVPAAILP